MSLPSRRFVLAAISIAAFFSGAALFGALANQPENAALKTQSVQPRVVTIAGMAFSPASLHVHVGETVEFQNKDIVPHTATSRVPGGFDSGMIKPGETWSVVLKTPGTFHFACQFHTEMVGEIVVEK